MYLQKTKRNAIETQIIFFITMIGLWQFFDTIFNFREVILPSPIEISTAFIENTPLLIKSLGITATESVLGFILGSSVAFFIAVIFDLSSLVKNIFYPYAIALKATPLYAMAPILILWFGTGIDAKIFLSALVSFFPVLVNTVDGLKSYTEAELNLFRLYKATNWQIFTLLKIPKAIPFIMPSLKTASTLSVVGAIVAEFISSSKGLGHTIINASYYLDTSLMFAAIILVSMLGVTFFFTLNFIEKRIFFWK